MVGVPALGLFGILEAGRGIAAPFAIGGEWTLQFDNADACAGASAKFRQPALSISQSGTQALITVNDGRTTTMQATVTEASLTAQSPAASIAASIGGKRGERTLAGSMNLDGCALHFHAVRQAAKKRAE